LGITNLCSTGKRSGTAAESKSNRSGKRKRVVVWAKEDVAQRELRKSARKRERAVSFWAKQ